jgi:hypothetical protein
VVLGNFNLSEIIRFAEVLKGLANPMLSVLCLFLSTMFSVFRSQVEGAFLGRLEGNLLLSDRPHAEAYSHPDRPLRPRA